MSKENEQRQQGIRGNLIGVLLWFIARMISLTIRLQTKNAEIMREFERNGKGAILITWHGRTMVPANYFRGRGYWALISLSRDGDIQNRIFKLFGFHTIRGSTGRGGVKAVLQMAKKVREGGILSYAPDGPRGPSHKVQEGTIFLAERCGCPVIPLGFSANPRILLKSWDSYLIPKFFAKGAMVLGDPIFVPPNMTDEQKQEIALKIEEAINQAEEEAERMVGILPAK
jgi:lysophospholipid acyltransferase (LPLAT)-like uncharacterized protein